MTFCDQLLASLRDRERRARAPTPQDPCHRQARSRRRPRLRRSPALRHQRPTISLLRPPNKMKTLTPIAYVSRNSSRLQHRLHHPSLSHAASLHHLLYQTMFLRLHLHHLRPLLVHLVRQLPAPQSMTTPPSQHRLFVIPTPQSRRRLYATSNHPPHPQMTNPNTLSAPPNAPR